MDSAKTPTPCHEHYDCSECSRHLQECLEASNSAPKPSAFQIANQHFNRPGDDYETRMMLANRRRSNTPHAVGHTWTIACHAPPRCKPDEEFTRFLRDAKALKTKVEQKWTAWLEDREDGIVGTGETENAAIVALGEQYRDEE
jgi:hypothetical protein